MKPVKIFEIKGNTWMDGLSAQSSSAIGGLFSSITNFDPFEIPGMMQCSLSSALASDSTITTTPNVLTSVSPSATAKILAHSDTKLYEVLDGSPWTTTDRTSRINFSTGVRGAIVYKNFYFYSQTAQVRAIGLPVSSGTDTQVFASFASTGSWHPFCVGADGKLYHADGSGINLIKTTASLDNTGATIVSLEAGMYVRHLINDGRYLVILADNNGSGDPGTSATPLVPVSGNYRCQVLFWDMVKGTFDQLYEFNDSYLIGGEYLDGGIYVFSGNGIYVCNVQTPPKQIFSFTAGSTITEKPQTPFQITRAKHSIYWCGQSNGAIYAYGSLFPGMKKIFYQPFSANYTPSAITNNGTNFYIGTSGANNFLRVTGTGSTRNTGSVVTAPIVLPNPYRIEFVKVLMQQPLASGDSINAYINSQAGNAIVLASNSRSYTQLGAKQTIIFEKSAGGDNSSAKEYFEDFQLTISSNKAVASVEVWATPHPDYAQGI